MTAKQLVQERLPAWSEEDAEIALRAVEHKHQLEPNGNGDSKATEPKKRRRLSFSGIGASDASDVSERFDEYLGRAIDARHPRS